MSDLVHVKGLSDLEKFFNELPAKYAKNVARGGLRKGGNVIKATAQTNIHSVSGNLAKSLKVRSDSRGGQVTAKVYTRLFYATFVEYGTKPHDIPKEGTVAFGGRVYSAVHHPGAKGAGFMRNALDTQAGAAVTAFAEYSRDRMSTKYGLDTADLEFEEGA